MNKQTKLFGNKKKRVEFDSLPSNTNTYISCYWYYCFILFDKMEEKEKIQSFADKITSFLHIVDIFDEDVEELESWISSMKDNLSFKKSIWPMFDLNALEKTDVESYKIQVFQKIIDLIKTRREQIKETIKMKNEISERSSVLKELWL